MKDEIRVPYGLIDERLVHAKDAARDAAYACPACAAPLIQRRGRVRVAHFAHDSSATCAYETAVHKTAKLLVVQAIKDWRTRVSGPAAPAARDASRHWRCRRMCVIMSNMKSASVREIQHDLKRVLAWVEGGEEVLIRRRAKVVARLVPPAPVVAPTPDFIVRARAIWGDRPRGTALSKLVSDARGDR